MHAYLASAHRTLDIESAAIAQLAVQLDDSFVAVVDLLCACEGRVVVMGMGKSGHIGRKIAATLSSTGTPAFFVHPAEASHGDLGMVTSKDVVLAISNSGESDELAVILPLLKRASIPIVALTGNAQSTLAQHADHVLLATVAKEACPLNLAPTASTTAQLALGDALAIACLESRGFQAEDFAKSHPGGALGRKLFTKVSDVMRTGAAIPVVSAAIPFIELMKRMSDGGLGLAVAVDAQHKPLGVFTDGDLRRELLKGTDLLKANVAALLRPNPRAVEANALAVEAAAQMETHRVTALLVVDESGKLVGVVNSHDLLRAKVI